MTDLTEADRAKLREALKLSDAAIEAAAKVIMERTFGYSWDSLSDNSIVDRGFKPVIFSSMASMKWQGGKPDMMNIARDCLKAALGEQQ